MITNDIEAYFLGLMYAKGDILVLNDDFIQFKINIKFRRPNDESIRKDNIYTKISKNDSGKEKLESRFTRDLYTIAEEFNRNFDCDFKIILDAHGEPDGWGKKTMSIISRKIKNNNAKFTSLFCVDKLDENTLKKFPFELNIHNSKKYSLAFIQGVCDAASLIPNEASSQNGGTGNPRIQIEPNQDRWELCIGLCQAFQDGLNIRVNNINWGHPQIRTFWKGQNHQFRVSLNDIPNEIQLYRLSYKLDEYDNLYKRSGIQYNPSQYLCPLNKKGIHHGDQISISKSTDKDLNDTLLHNNLRGLSIDVVNKKSIIVCYLMGCKKCKEFININII